MEKLIEANMQFIFLTRVIIEKMFLLNALSETINWQKVSFPHE